METVLDDREVRVLGCLIEKEMTTPEYYPLSLNALTNACNQRSNRTPVVSYDEAVVVRALEDLERKRLVGRTHLPGSRVPKYLHTFLDRFDLSKQEIAVLCELMLRGPQTLGEIRSHAERMSTFENLEEVEETLQGLTDQDPPLAARLQREPGRKECRYRHLLSGSITTGVSTHGEPAEPPSPQERFTRLEEEIVRLKREIEELRQAFAEFRSQF